VWSVVGYQRLSVRRLRSSSATPERSTTYVGNQAVRGRATFKKRKETFHRELTALNIYIYIFTYIFADYFTAVALSPPPVSTLPFCYRLPHRGPFLPLLPSYRLSSPVYTSPAVPILALPLAILAPPFSYCVQSVTIVVSAPRPQRPFPPP
jgi:hypothetical protein